MDIRNHIADRMEGMYEVLENSSLYCDYIGVSEGLIARIKQMKADKKARKAAEAERKRLEEEEKAEQRRIANAAKKEKANANAMLKYVIYENGESEGQRDFEDLIEEVQSIIRREIPGVRFENRKPSHNQTQLGDGYVLHKYTATIFTMNDKNLKGFISNTKNGKLKMLNGAKNAIDASKKINAVGKFVSGQVFNGNDIVLSRLGNVSDSEIQKLVDTDFKDRIADPIAGLGMKYKRNFLINYKDGLEYTFVKMDSMYFGYGIQVGIRYITKN